MHRSRRLLPLGLGLFWVAAAIGCTAIPGSESAVAAISKDSRQRRAELVREFEERRDEANYQAALNRHRAGDFDGCEQGLQRLLLRRPDHRQAGLLWIELQLGQNDPLAAEDTAQRLALAYPDDAEVQEAAERVAAAVDDDDPADIADTADVSDHADHSGGAGDADALLLAALDAIDARDEVLALDLVERSQVAAPRDPQVAIRAAVGALRSAQPSLAVELARRGVARFPDNAALHQTLGHSCYRGGNLEAAQVSLRQALSLDSRCGLTYFLMGQTLEKLGRREEAKRHFATAGRLDRRWAAATR